MQEFRINKDNNTPLLKMELFNDGRTDFNKFYEIIQNSTISFTMKDIETDVTIVSNEPAIILPKDGCVDDEYYVCYKWKTRDTKRIGKYYGEFKIVFGDVVGGGTLIVPIQERLIINIQ